MMPWLIRVRQLSKGVGVAINALAIMRGDCGCAANAHSAAMFCHLMQPQRAHAANNRNTVSNENC
jgi:hypothetical protein